MIYLETDYDRIADAIYAYFQPQNRMEKVGFTWLLLLKASLPPKGMNFWLVVWKNAPDKNDYANNKNSSRDFCRLNQEKTVQRYTLILNILEEFLYLNAFSGMHINHSF